MKSVSADNAPEEILVAAKKLLETVENDPKKILARYDDLFHNKLWPAIERHNKLLNGKLLSQATVEKAEMEDHQKAVREFAPELIVMSVAINLWEKENGQKCSNEHGTISYGWHLLSEIDDDCTEFLSHTVVKDQQAMVQEIINESKNSGDVPEYFSVKILIAIGIEAWEHARLMDICFLSSELDGVTTRIAADKDCIERYEVISEAVRQLVESGDLVENETCFYLGSLDVFIDKAKADLARLEGYLSEINKNNDM